MMEFSNLILAPLNLKNLLGLSSTVENLAGITKSKAISSAVRYSLLGSSSLLTLQILKWGITGNFNIRKPSQHFPWNSFSSACLYFWLLRNKTVPYLSVQFLSHSQKLCRFLLIDTVARKAAFTIWTFYGKKSLTFIVSAYITACARWGSDLSYWEHRKAFVEDTHSCIIYTFIHIYFYTCIYRHMHIWVITDLWGKYWA